MLNDAHQVLGPDEDPGTPIATIGLDDRVVGVLDDATPVTMADVYYRPHIVRTTPSFERWRVVDERLQFVERAAGFEPVARIALLRHAGQRQDAHAGAERRERRPDLKRVATPRLIVVRDYDDFFGARLAQIVGILVAPGASTHWRRGGGQPEGGDVVSVFFPLDEQHEPLALQFREPVRYAAHAVHLPDPLTLSITATQA